MGKFIDKRRKARRDRTIRKVDEMIYAQRKAKTDAIAREAAEFLRQQANLRRALGRKQEETV